MNDPHDEWPDAAEFLGGIVFTDPHPGLDSLGEVVVFTDARIRADLAARLFAEFDAPCAGEPV